MKYAIIVISLWTLSLSSLYAQDVSSDKENGKEVKVSLKDGAKPDIYIDGKKYDYEIMELLDPDKIKAINVIKGDEAKKEYNAPNGVILITTSRENPSIKVDFSKSDDQQDTKVMIRGGGSDDPLVIIDGKVSSKSNLDQLKPDEIDVIEVVKGEKAAKEYQSASGVIIITTKKKKKK